MNRLADLVAILYRPAETMRRILDRPDRWGAHVVFLAFVCGSANDVDLRALPQVLPALSALSTLAIAALSLISGGLLWVAALFVLSWIATAIGRMMSGTGTAADVRAALGWAMVPVIWSIVYRIPFVILEMHVPVDQKIDAHRFLIGFLAHGGCSLVVLFLGLQLLFALWCVGLGCFTVGEAHHFGAQKGFITVAITIALPLMVIGAAVFVTR